MRPRIKLPITAYDVVLETLGWLLLCILWVVTLWYFPALPSSIPVHFNLKGQPDHYGAKQLIFLLPVIATLLLAALTFLNRHPHIFNYPVKITSDNALRQYIVATRMIRFLKLVIALIFLLIIRSTLQVLPEAPVLPGAGMVPVLLAVTLLFLVFYIVRAVRDWD